MLFAHHVIIGGYRQHRGRIAGVDRVYQTLRQFVQPGVRCELKSWNDNWDHEAEFISRHRAHPGAMPLVLVYCYSYGCGWGLIQLARQLNRRGLSVHGVRACDPVYRHPSPFGRWRSLWPFSKIRLPGNVLTERAYCDDPPVKVFVQRNSLPAGHRVLTAAGKEIQPVEIEDVMIDGMVVEATHLNIDESGVWIRSCTSLAKSYQEEIESRMAL